MRAFNQNNRGSNERVTDAVDNDLNRFISKKKKKPPKKTSEPLSSTGNDAGMYICKSFYTS